MFRHLSAKPFLAAALAIGALGAATAAHARSDVVFSIGFNQPYGYSQPEQVYVQPQPVYVQPQPVYVRPQPVYVRPAPVYYPQTPVYTQPQPVYYDNHGGYRSSRRGGAWGDDDRDGVANIYENKHRRHGHGGSWGWRDDDGDGVPNRYDREPHNPYRH